MIPNTDPIIPTESAEVSEPSISLPTAGETPPANPTPGPALTEPDPETVAIEIRNSIPEFDQTGLSRKLAAPAALLVLLALVGWLVFEGRLRRLAHAAAIRRGMPMPGMPGMMPGMPGMMPGMMMPGMQPMPGMQMPGQPMPGQAMPGQMMPYPGYPVQPYQPPVVSYVPVPYPMPYPQQPYGQPEAQQQSYPPPAQAPVYPQGYVIERTIEEPLPGGTATFPAQGDQSGEQDDPRRRRPY
ncbi:hypothetical protein [Acrocarpospora sp. B8E8]|uniref:hypothetical protein n=1 Tax=Acrocarpospora sp. B8E8 TaxID=3153572 RepID=UPI00325FD000